MRLSFGAGLLCLVGFGAQAESDADVRASRLLIKAFVGVCVQSLPRLDKIEAAASVGGWKELLGDEATLMAPMAPEAWSRSWLVSDAADVPFMIGISRATEPKRKIVVCSLTNPYAPPTPMKSALKQILNLGIPMIEKREAGSQMTSWPLKQNEMNLQISFLDSYPSGDPGVTISAAIVDEIK